MRPAGRAPSTDTMHMRLFTCWRVHVLTLDLKSLGDGLDPRIVIASLMRFVVRHIGKTGSAAHGASQQGFVLLSRHLANMRPRAPIFQCGTLPQSSRFSYSSNVFNRRM